MANPPEDDFAEEPPILDFNEFRDAGYLQEVNRLFFHPLGLAMAVDFEDDKVTGIAGVYTTDDPEGWCYADDTIDMAKAANIARILSERAPARREALGYVIQPVPNQGETADE